MGRRWNAGAATMWAAWRGGLKDLAKILPAFPTSISATEELGGIANPTQMEVNNEKSSGERPTFQRDPGYEAWLDQRAADAARQPDGQGMTREL